MFGNGHAILVLMNRKRIGWMLTICCLWGHSFYAQRLKWHYNNPSDTLSNYYAVMQPQSTPKAWMLLLAGFGETPQSVLKETDIPRVAAQNGILVIIPALSAGWQTFYIDEKSQYDIDSLVKQAIQQYDLSKIPFLVGGFSLGGSGAIKWAERALKGQCTPLPKAVFGIDPPLDFERFYESIEHTIWLSQSAIANEEAKYLAERIRTVFDGTPQQNPQRYQELSCFSYKNRDLARIGIFKNIPIQLLSEPAIEWQMKERNRDLYDLNSIDCVAMINTLKIIGNTKAELVLSVDKGWRRQQKVKNPHSWSIAEPHKIVRWLLTQIQ